MIRFFDELHANNTREWFSRNKERYERCVLVPAMSFVEAMGHKLRKLWPDIVADPRVNRSIFRIYRDIRFSRDKKPYKTNLGIFFWLPRPWKLGAPGFYVHYSNHRIMLAAGIYTFPRELLTPYRDAVVGKRTGARLRRIVAGLLDKGYSLGGRHYKRIPRGYSAQGLTWELLLHRGLYAWVEMPCPAAMHDRRFLSFCHAHFSEMNPLVEWTARLDGEAKRPSGHEGPLGRGKRDTRRWEP